jgi:hypothetical protein
MGSSSSDCTIHMLTSTRYADVTHEASPITSGHRLVLTYHIVHRVPSVHLSAAATLRDDIGQLRDVFRQWSVSVWADLSGDEPDPFLCHYLEHRYTERNLSLSRLRGTDLTVVTRAADAAKQADFIIYLALLERKRVMECECDQAEFQGADHEHLSDYEFNEGESTDSWILKKIVTLDGTHVAEDFCISGREMIDYGALDGAEADQEEFSEWKCDTGTQTTLWYRRSVSSRNTHTICDILSADQHHR